MRLFLLLALVLGACRLPAPPTVSRPPADCTSTCGAKLYGIDDCAGLNAMEEREQTFVAPVVAAFDPHVYGFCAQMKSWVINAVPVAGGSIPYPSSPTGRAGGYSDCVLRDTQMYFDPDAGFDWKRSSYAHEMAHASECPIERYAHEGWEDAGINHAIILVNSPN